MYKIESLNACENTLFHLMYYSWLFCFFQEHHEEDFFLYIAYSDESVYGA